MEIEKLFEIECSDNTKLWASMQNNSVVYGSFGKGINLAYIEILQKIPYTKLCYFSRELSHTSKYIINYIDYVEQNSNELQKQLLKAF